MEFRRTHNYWDFVYEGPSPTYSLYNYGWKTTHPEATYGTSEGHELGDKNEEAQIHTYDSENLMLNLVSDPSYAYYYGYFVEYTLYRAKRTVGRNLPSRPSPKSKHTGAIHGSTTL